MTLNSMDLRNFAALYPVEYGEWIDLIAPMGQMIADVVADNEEAVFFVDGMGTADGSRATVAYWCPGEPEEFAAYNGEAWGNGPEDVDAAKAIIARFGDA